MDPWYSRPSSGSIRFDLLTIFVATAIWAALLCAMRLLHFPLRGFVYVSVVLVVVYSAVAFLRQVNRPITTSIGCGILVTVVGEMIFRKLQGNPFGNISLGDLTGGAISGLFALFALNVVFLISNRIRSRFQRRRDD